VVCEEKSIGAEDAAASTAINPASTAFADDIDAPAEKSSTPATTLADANEDPRAMPNDSSDGLASGQDAGKSSASEDEADTP
jgi:hypothetical protein